jgi:hypothetical protein
MELNFLFVFLLCSCSWRSLLPVVEVEHAGGIGVADGAGSQGAFFCFAGKSFSPGWYYQPRLKATFSTGSFNRD